MTRPGRRDGTRCPACRADVFKHKADQAIPFNVIADLAPLTPAEIARLWEPNRLAYCLVQVGHVPPRLRLIGAWHAKDCPHRHVIEHRCPPEIGEFGRKPEGALW